MNYNISFWLCVAAGIITLASFIWPPIPWQVPVGLVIIAAILPAHT